MGCVPILIWLATNFFDEHDIRPCGQTPFDIDMFAAALSQRFQQFGVLIGNPEYSPIRMISPNKIAALGLKILDLTNDKNRG